MKLKWDRLSILLAFVMGLMVLAAFVFGHVYFLAPIKQGADRAAQLVAEQTSLLADYPPEATLLEEYRQTYEETWEFLPEGERVDQELVIMEQLAAEENVLVQQIVRAEEPEPIEGLDESYMKSTYAVEMTSNTAGNMQKLVERLEGLDRIWNIYSFGFEKIAEESFNGTFTFELFYYVAGSEESQ